MNIRFMKYVSSFGYPKHEIIPFDGLTKPQSFASSLSHCIILEYKNVSILTKGTVCHSWRQTYLFFFSPFSFISTFLAYPTKIPPTFMCSSERNLGKNRAAITLKTPHISHNNVAATAVGQELVEVEPCLAPEQISQIWLDYEVKDMFGRNLDLDYHVLPHIPFAILPPVLAIPGALMFGFLQVVCSPNNFPTIALPTYHAATAYNNCCSAKFVIC